MARRARRRRLRSPADRHLAAAVAHAGLHYLESWNEAVCNGAWGSRRPGSVSGCARRSTSSTGRRSILARPSRPARCECHRHRRRRAAGVDRRAVGRRAPRVPGGGRLPARDGHALGGLPGDLLAVPQPARRARAAIDPLGLRPRDAAGGAALRAGGRRPPAGAVALHARGAVLRQPGLAGLRAEGAARRLWLQKTVPEENEGYSSRRSSSASRGALRAGPPHARERRRERTSRQLGCAEARQLG